MPFLHNWGIIQPMDKTTLQQQNPIGWEKSLLLIATIYISLIIFSNLGSLRIITLLGLSLDGGTLLYPFTFTMRDILHKKAGAKLARFTIYLSAIVNLLLFGFVWLVGILPPDLSVGGQTEYALVLSPGIRLVLASIIAATLAELLDTTVYSIVRRRFGTKKQWLRVLFSNLFSIPVDTAVFLLLAFAGRFSMATLLAIFWGNLALKFAVSLLSMGGVYLVKEDRE